MRVLPYLKSPTGNLVLFFGFIAVGGLLVFRSNAREKAQAAQMTKVTASEQGAARESITRNGLPFKLPPLVRKSATVSDVPVSDPDETPTATAVDARGQRVAAKGTEPRVLPISLFSVATDSNAAPPLSKTYAPFGRLIPCETVITVESSKLDTPVIGLVTEDIYHNGELIIPAGTEVHGRASLDRARERIAASGKWVVVWRDGSPLNGTELVLNGIALDREKDDVSGEFGMRDGSAGLLGDLIKSDNWQEIRLFASTFLAGFAGGLQQLQNQGTAFGGVAQVPVVSTRNAALAGTADVLNAYARQIQEAIARDGFFVRVPAGKQFYLYVTETIDQAKGTRGNRSNEEIWRKQQ
ncbi:MAG: TrbI/VirB10 family protein [Opitutae bacterium]|nr:TrbI/VirB10 family protein [Opitutae bacterium]